MTLIEFEKTVMKRPFRYFIIDNINKGLIYETNKEPITRELMTYQPTSDPKVFILRQTKTAYIDTRYEAKIRLYNYLRERYKIPKYQPYKNYPKDIPILTF
jgi:hypothetical protein